jgi:cysteate synthase
MSNDYFKPTEYKLRCLACGKEFTEDNHLLSCDADHGPAFLRAEYAARKLTVRQGAQGMFRFGDWLPLRRPIANQALPVTYKSKGLASHLGLENLWVVFSGYWPDRGADMRTCTFKEQEAPPVCSRLASDGKTLVLASAGNTSRAFAEICSANNIPLLMVVNEAGLKCMWSTKPFSDSVKLVAVTADADYSDAIRLSGMIARLPGYVPEGGAKNVARRDGMGVSVLAAVTTSGRIPDHYFQAVGSGTGGISAWEAAERLCTDGRFGDVKMKLHLVQNHPFTPLVDAWNKGSRELLPMDEEEARRRIARIDAHVLSNRHPPYSLVGGVFDALTQTKGHMYAVTNEEARAANALFEETEGADLTPSAAVAAGALRKAIEQKTISPDEMVLLNVTGGGQGRLFAEHKINYLKPHIEVRRGEITEETVQSLFA